MANQHVPDRIERLSLLAQALGSSPDWAELSRLMVLRIFDGWGCTGAVLFGPASNGTLSLEASFGYPDDLVAGLHAIPRDIDSPLRVAMHSDEVIWLPDPVDVKESSGDLPLAPAGTESMIVLPVTRLGIPEHVLALAFSEPLPANPASGPFVMAVKSLLELHGGAAEWAVRPNGVTGHAAPAAHPTSPEDVDLTARQERILRLLAQEKTNRWIASELGFSESTIRQETLRLYRALGVNSRSDAVRVAQFIGIIPQ